MMVAEEKGYIRRALDLEPHFLFLDCKI